MNLSSESRIQGLEQNTWSLSTALGKIEKPQSSIQKKQDVEQTNHKKVRIMR